ncbi:hypothetical protein ISN45_Aa05g020990 [Arabidopsis thaliana x Arabidopsis arenosa]|uniref:Uncharacterized protein n=1 Tax=Arabidopsis thaliana x Arabidopsis arenosa TaxID=1240361 RepID=A0A8T1ZPM7_9BRAS|nr:hypothetical protein ISN45_Aa05g020990 [Arabidopsis thaliana x Arabidopsis arenosa]KAG7560585.1 hypothetical protein ISN45_Aa05g020990 [Arabidopsis thaliana x Arabidopsis arenosa]
MHLTFIVDGFYLNLLDWGVLAIALGHTLYLWDASTGVTIDEEKGPFNWAPDGRHVHLWDSASNRNQLRTLKSRITGMEQSHSYYWRNKWTDH